MPITMSSAKAPHRATGKKVIPTKKKRTPCTQTELLETVDAPLTNSLRTIPPEDWRRTWAACRTMMLRTDLKQSDGASGQDVPAFRCAHAWYLLGMSAKLHQHTDHVRARRDGFNLSLHVRHLCLISSLAVVIWR
jgi:hypothetical protein